jgi:hypothetical protein
VTPPIPARPRRRRHPPAATGPGAGRRLPPVPGSGKCATTRTARLSR